LRGGGNSKKKKKGAAAGGNSKKNQRRGKKVLGRVKEGEKAKRSLKTWGGMGDMGLAFVPRVKI